MVAGYSSFFLYNNNRRHRENGSCIYLVLQDAVSDTFSAIDFINGSSGDSKMPCFSVLTALSRG